MGRLGGKLWTNRLTRKVLTPCVRRFFRSGDARVLVRMDGGICSQIQFYLLGAWFEQQGFRVSYDLEWFETCGRDLNGRFVRNFDLLRLQPALPLETIGGWRCFLYKTYLAAGQALNRAASSAGEADVSFWQTLTPPVYLGGYYRPVREMFTEMLPRLFPYERLKDSLDEANRRFLERLEATPDSVALHVRRGDLSTFVPAYGEPCSFEYFREAVSQFNASASFFIFSDEPDWCRQELLPRLPQGRAYEVVSLNGSDRGYMDLVLMAACHHIIASKGSLGKFAALLRPLPDRRVISSPDDSDPILLAGSHPTR